MILVFGPVVVLGLVNGYAFIDLVLTIQRMRKTGEYPPIPPYSAVILPYWEVMRINWGVRTYPRESPLFWPARLMRWTTWLAYGWWGALIFGWVLYVVVFG